MSNGFRSSGSNCAENREIDCFLVSDLIVSDNIVKLVTLKLVLKLVVLQLFRSRNWLVEAGLQQIQDRGDAARKALRKDFNKPIK